MAGLEQSYRDLNQMPLNCFLLIKNIASSRFLGKAKITIWDLASSARSKTVRPAKSKNLLRLSDISISYFFKYLKIYNPGIPRKKISFR